MHIPPLIAGGVAIGIKPCAISACRRVPSLISIRIRPVICLLIPSVSYLSTDVYKDLSSYKKRCICKMYLACIQNLFVAMIFIKKLKFPFYAVDLIDHILQRMFLKYQPVILFLYHLYHSAVAWIDLKFHSCIACLRPLPFSVITLYPIREEKNECTPVQLCRSRPAVVKVEFFAVLTHKSFRHESFLPKPSVIFLRFILLVMHSDQPTPLQKGGMLTESVEINVHHQNSKPHRRLHERANSVRFF